MILSTDAFPSFYSKEFKSILSHLPYNGITKAGAWIAGGSIRRAMFGQPLDCDIDIFFSDEKQLFRFRSWCNERARKLYKNDFNTSYEMNMAFAKVKVQLITFKFFPTPDAVIDDFDFTLCQTLFDGNVIHTTETALKDIEARSIVPHNLNGAVSATRFFKYLDQGFSMSAENIIKTFTIVNEQIKNAPPVENVLKTMEEVEDDEEVLYDSYAGHRTYKKVKKSIKVSAVAPIDWMEIFKQ